MADIKKKDLEKFKKLLDEEKKKILRHLESLSESSEQEQMVVGSGDPVDIAATGINQANLQKIGKRETYLLKKIDLALEKIENGTYGECESCGGQIAVPRLIARPVAQLCIDCKTEQENTERKFTNRDSSEEDEDGAGDEGEEG